MFVVNKRVLKLLLDLVCWSVVAQEESSRVELVKIHLCDNDANIVVVCLPLLPCKGVAWFWFVYVVVVKRFQRVSNYCAHKAE